jgi:hypothetical protein
MARHILDRPIARRSTLAALAALLVLYVVLVVLGRGTSTTAQVL